MKPSETFLTSVERRLNLAATPYFYQAPAHSPPGGARLLNLTLNFSSLSLALQTNVYFRASPWPFYFQNNYDLLG
jgi:hypothetical protein